MTVPLRPRSQWQLPRGAVMLGERTLLMGIVNVTPDSFSDGGRYVSLDAAAAHGLALLDQGADILDLGGESTRPNATPLSPRQEQERLLPVLRALRRSRPEALLSVDTYHAVTAEIVLAAGADIINDVSGLLWDPAMPRTLAAAEPAPGVILMHTRGRPGEWSSLPALAKGSILPLVRQELAMRLEVAMADGLDPEIIVLDPGFGFGKRGVENEALLARLQELHALGRPLLVGLSRKGFLAEGSIRLKASEEVAGDARLHATIAANTAAILAGAHLLRVHDVAAARAAAAVADRILRASESENKADRRETA